MDATMERNAAMTRTQNAQADYTRVFDCFAFPPLMRVQVEGIATV